MLSLSRGSERSFKLIELGRCFIRKEEPIWSRLSDLFISAHPIYSYDEKRE